MNARVLAATALAVAVAVPAGADAAPRKACHLLGASKHATDAPSADGLRILSADVASDAKWLTAVVRVESVDGPLDAASGRYFGFFFSTDVENNYSLEGTIRATGSRFALARVDKPFDPPGEGGSTSTFLTDAAAVVDTAKDEVRISVPVSALRRLAPRLRKGAKVTYLAALADRVYGVDRGAVPVPQGVPSGVGFSGDFVHGGKRVTYTLGSPSCVLPGR